MPDKPKASAFAYKQNRDGIGFTIWFRPDALWDTVEILKEFGRFVVTDQATHGAFTDDTKMAFYFPAGIYDAHSIFGYAYKALEEKGIPLEL